MARIPVGKVLLRNVIRHTDAHNKIQEESEMWKIREKEKQASKMRFHRQRRPSASLPGNRMRCDGYDEEDEGAEANFAARKVFASPQDERESRYWTKKLYEFEASDPNRWGHSGYKELYPEEFESEGDRSDSEELPANGAKPAPAKPPKSAPRKRKRSSKASKKKRKKKSRKKLRRKKSLQCGGSSSEEEEEDSDRRSRAKAKKKRRRKEARKSKEPPLGSGESSSSPGRASDSSSGDESDAGSRLGKRRRGKRRRSAPKGGADEEAEGGRRRHRNWKLARNDTSDDSGDDDLN
ncbi:NKAP domain containing 1 isoform X1 [Hypanus sabinus]|uniref:NKAP domain containing 1 isoform X1 n=1 Tax=Hypanus sabinus TaxID=79690 RepID=UPI0028C3D108|nr:NKAP domain containing 1 isoform X1 [Hypanus sabinus]XP_059813943.1 NKAP domain containing 1 isoform X1 [Hypanus sabinus]